MSFFYNLIIFPIVQLIELIFVFIFRIFKNTGLSILSVSIIVSVCTLPFYFFAEKIQEKEREIHKKLKPKIDLIKSVFKGDEQYMMLSTYYRQNEYHPVYAMRNSIVLLIQIPFFIAAYSYLSHLHLLNNASFFFINDLGKPDSLINIGKININILPLLMTIINIASGVIYTKNLESKDKIQLYGIAFVFLLLLYNSPSGLVLYWTMNNIFSLLKNIFQKINNPKEIIYIILILVITVIIIFLIFFHTGDPPKRLLAVLFFLSVLLLPVILKICRSIPVPYFIKNNTAIKIPAYIYIFSCVILFILYGYIIPSSLIASSVTDFSFIDSYTTPFPFLLFTLIQSAGIFLFWPILIYYIFLANIRVILSSLMTILAVIALINVFTITENFGFLTTTMFFSDPKPFYLIQKLTIINIIIILLTITLLTFLLLFKKIRIIASGQIVVIITLFALFIINTFHIRSDFILAQEKYISHEQGAGNFISEYNFSKNGKNVLVLLLDSVVGSFVPFVFEEKPHIKDVMRGFKHYPNTSSFANHTLIGALPIYGGYEYSPESINKRNDTTLLDKQKEAYLLLPQILNDAGFSVTVTDPPFDNKNISNISIFSDFPQYNVKNLYGKYTANWLKNNKDVEILKISEYLNKYLIRFSFFKGSPLFLRIFIYDRGDWLTLKYQDKNQITNIIIDDYAFLDSLDKITGFDMEGDTFTTIYIHLPHSFTFLQAPDYHPTANITNKGTSIFADDPTFHLTIAAFQLLANWFEILKENNVYDNTKIIMVSDHGRSSLPVYSNLRLPNGQFLYSYNALLMIKDFNSNSEIESDFNFMTNGDAPLLVLNGIIDNPVNPFSGNPLKQDKENGIFIPAIGAVSTYAHGKYVYNIGKDDWLFVKDDIFNPDNWKAITK